LCLDFFKKKKGSRQCSRGTGFCTAFLQHLPHSRRGSSRQPCPSLSIAGVFTRVRRVIDMPKRTFCPSPRGEAYPSARHKYRRTIDVWRGLIQKRRLPRWRRGTVKIPGLFGQLHQTSRYGSETTWKMGCLMEGEIGTFNLEQRLYVERAISREEIFAITRVASIQKSGRSQAGKVLVSRPHPR
jgi:hypothetical protein